MQSSTLGRLAPTGKSVTIKGMDLYRIRDGQIVDVRDSLDRLSMFQQLGLLTTRRQATE